MGRSIRWRWRLLIAFANNDHHVLMVSASLSILKPHVAIIFSPPPPFPISKAKDFLLRRERCWWVADLAHRDHFYRRFSTRSYQARLEKIEAFLPVSIEILKDVPYQVPPVLSGLKINYFGDGFGIYPSGHQLWWHPEPPPRLDRRISAVPTRPDDWWSCPLAIASPDKAAFCRVNADCRAHLLALLELRSAPYRRQVLTALKDASDLVFLSQLARVRCTPEAEVELLAHDMNVHISAGASALLFGHPTQTASHLTGLVNGLQRRLGLWRSLQLAPMPPKKPGQPRLAVVQIIQILEAAPGVPQPTVHVFQSAILPLRILFPNVAVRFGYGDDRIRTHFLPRAAERQLHFEASTAACLALAPVPT